MQKELWLLSRERPVLHYNDAIFLELCIFVTNFQLEIYVGFVWLSYIQRLNHYEFTVTEVMMRIVARLFLSENNDLNKLVILNLGYLF